MKSRASKIHICLSGVNLNRIYRECEKNHIQLYNISRDDYKQIQFDISPKNKIAVRQIAKKHNYKYVEDTSKGFGKIMQFVKLRFGILLGVCLFLVLNFISGFFVWDIKIYGNQKVKTEEILSLLKTQKIQKGSIKNTQTLQTLEDEILNNFDDISLCSVMVKGTSVIINVKEKISVDAIDGEVQSDIIAPKNMTITELSVVNGTALKSVGDSVKKGEVIVAGYVFDVSGNKVFCKANASIKAKTWHTSTEIYKKQIEVLTRTGKTSKTSYIQLFDMKFGVTNQKNAFDCYETETYQTNLNNNFLPIKMFTIIHYEATKQTVTQNFENDKEQIISNCQKIASRAVEDDEVVTNIFDIVTEEDDKFVVTSYVEVLFEM